MTSRKQSGRKRKWDERVRGCKREGVGERERERE
jgi:hypothetical protein